MSENLLPMPHMHKLLDEIVPELRWDGVIPYKEWKAAARARLHDLLGISEILLKGDEGFPLVYRCFNLFDFLSHTCMNYELQKY